METLLSRDTALKIPKEHRIKPHHGILWNGLEKPVKARGGFGARPIQTLVFLPVKWVAGSQQDRDENRENPVANPKLVGTQRHGLLGPEGVL